MRKLVRRRVEVEAELHWRFGRGAKSRSLLMFEFDVRRLYSPQALANSIHEKYRSIQYIQIGLCAFAGANGYPRYAFGVTAQHCLAELARSDPRHAKQKGAKIFKSCSRETI